MPKKYLYPEAYTTITDDAAKLDVSYLSENSMNFYPTPQRWSYRFSKNWKVVEVHKVNISAGDVLEYVIDTHYGSRTSYKEITENSSLMSPVNSYRKGDIVPMITYRGSKSAEVSRLKEKVLTQASSVQLGGPACLTFSVRKYFSHSFPGGRLKDHTNYTSVVTNDLPTDQRQFPYSEIVNYPEDKRDGWVVDFIERAGGSL